MRVGNPLKMHAGVTNMTLGRSGSYSKAESRVHFRLKDEMNQLDDDAEATVRDLEMINKTNFVPSWNLLKTLFSSVELEAFEVCYNEDYQVQGKNGAVNSKDLFSNWSKGVKHPHAGVTVENPSLWELDKTSRDQLVKSLIERRRTRVVGDLVRSITRFNMLGDQMRDLREHSKFRNLPPNKRIIGCTTSKAAMSYEGLKGFNASVLMLEEAGEILESHVLANLQSSMKQLIMIGDHLQLRPKVNNYLMKVENPHSDINLDSKFIFSFYMSPLLPTH